MIKRDFLSLRDFTREELLEILERAEAFKQGRFKQSLAGKASRQVKIERADHFFTGRETEMVEAVAAFLTDTLK